MAKRSPASKNLVEKWRDINYPNSFSNLSYFIRGLHKRGDIPPGPEGSAPKIRKILEDDLTYQASRGLRRRFQRRKDLAIGLNQRWEADLGDIGERRFRNLVTGATKGRFFLLVINVFSKMVWARALTNKTAAGVLAAFKNIARSLRPPYEMPDILETDGGKEFVNSRFREFLRRRGVFFSLSQGFLKARNVERAIRSFKAILIRLIETRPDMSWSEAIKASAGNMNRRFHRTIGMSPNEASAHSEEIRRKNFSEIGEVSFGNFLKEQKRLEEGGSVRDGPQRRLRFRIGDAVLIPFPRRKPKESKESDRAFSYHVHTVVGIKTEARPYLYVLADAGGKRLKRHYYAAELRKVKKPEKFPISAVKRYKRLRGMKMALVSWRDYPEEYDLWIPASAVGAQGRKKGGH